MTKFIFLTSTDFDKLIIKLKEHCKDVIKAVMLHPIDQKNKVL